MKKHFKKFVILNAVKDLFADFTGRRSMANNRSFTAFRMTKNFFCKELREISHTQCGGMNALQLDSKFAHLKFAHLKSVPTPLPR
jgi:hypothetical protein